MSLYRVLFLREDLSRRFREMPAAAVKTRLREKDYAPALEIEAPNEYAAWQALQSPIEGGRRFTVGDVLEAPEGKLRLCLFGGFEEATWWTPEVRDAASAPSGNDPPGGGGSVGPFERPSHSQPVD